MGVWLDRDACLLKRLAGFLSHSRRANFSYLLRQQAPWGGALLLVAAYLSATQPVFASWANLMRIIKTNSVVVILPLRHYVVIAGAISPPPPHGLSPDPDRRLPSPPRASGFPLG